MSDDGDYQPLYCLKCGELQDPENSSYCSHVTFVYLPHYDFEYVRPDFESTVAGVQQRSQQDGVLTVEESLLELPATSSCFIVEVVGASMNCGPSEFRVLYGFDLTN